MTQIVAIDTPSPGDRSCLVSDGRVAFVVDPRRDIDRVRALAAQHDVRITDVFEPHIHNDHVAAGVAASALFFPTPAVFQVAGESWADSSSASSMQRRRAGEKS